VQGPTDYDAIAKRYAAGIDERTWNALYERPHMMSLLPDLAGRDLLDAGCGHGWYAEQFVARGARVTGVDLSAKLLKVAQDRLGKQVALVHTSVSDLTMFEAESFDLIVSALVVHYVEDLRTMFAEWTRVLRPGGRVVFSTVYPDREATSQPKLIEETWSWLDAKVRFYQRSQHGTIEPMVASGIALDDISTPTPSEALREKDPRGYERLARKPDFMFVRGHKR
jgi:ubiquinone/menaquinone biosynthesis C-methylase UbiE